MSPMSAPARADARSRVAMLRWMRLARALGERIAEGVARGRLERTASRADGPGPAGRGRASGASDTGAIATGGTGIGGRGIDTGLGREALLVGACSNMREADVLAPSPGDVAAYLMRGIGAGEIVAQYFGRATDISRGRDGGGSMGNAARRLIAPVSGLLTSVSVAAGAAFALARAGEGAVALCFFHERASCRGDWHEGMNFAAVQKLPVVYVCASAAASDQPAVWSGVERVSERAVAYGIPGVTIDGSDVMEVFQAVGDAAVRARRGEGPSLVEGRIPGVDDGMSPHGLGAPAIGANRLGTDSVSGGIKANSEDAIPRRRPSAPEDALERFARGLVRDQLLDTEALAGMDSAIEREIEEAFAWAAAQPYPRPEDLVGGVYAGSSGPAL